MLIIVPFLLYYLWRKGLDISGKLLLLTGIFGIAFGFLEAIVVVYLRKILELLSSANLNGIYEQPQIASHLSSRLLTIEIYREAATMIMLASIALIAVKARKERWAIFFWTFAWWDIFYYAGLWLIMKWPPSLTTLDVLFLIPVPWHSQVWFPISVSALVILSVLLKRTRKK